MGQNYIQKENRFMTKFNENGTKKNYLPGKCQ